MRGVKTLKKGSRSKVLQRANYQGFMDRTCLGGSKTGGPHAPRQEEGLCVNARQSQLEWTWASTHH